MPPFVQSLLQVVVFITSLLFQNVSNFLLLQICSVVDLGFMTMSPWWRCTNRVFTIARITSFVLQNMTRAFRSCQKKGNDCCSSWRDVIVVVLQSDFSNYVFHHPLSCLVLQRLQLCKKNRALNHFWDGVQVTLLYVAASLATFWKSKSFFFLKCGADQNSAFLLYRFNYLMCQVFVWF